MEVAAYRLLVAEVIEATWRVNDYVETNKPELGPPASPDAINIAEQQLGTSIPTDLRSLFLAVDEAHIFGDYGPVHSVTLDPRLPNPKESALVAFTKEAREYVDPPEWTFPGHIEYLPQPNIVALTGGGQFGHWYEASGPNAGSILQYDILALDWSIIKVAPSLDYLLLASLEASPLGGLFYGETTAHIFERYQLDQRPAM